MDHSEHHDYSQTPLNHSAGGHMHDDGHHGSMDHGSHGALDGTELGGVDLSGHPHAGHGGHSTESMVHHMMSMAFHGGYNETILFEQWKIDSLGGLLWSMLLIFIMAACYEGLKYYREHLFWKTYNALQYRPVTVTEKNPRNGNVSNNNDAMVNGGAGGGGGGDDGSRIVQPTMLSVMHLFQTFLHILQVTLSFMLMLIFMTYNTWLCLAVVFGAALGYFLFGWKKSVVVDVTEHCH
ncbi:high affinity copper uptake protein 1 isoform X2 [Sabethes cyaneus]|uniref:high affinity copper uptake protein 1 isoform X2 n=1 Tax=Sabethes cyaneus TaxID=53552 RepID=UPI00237D7D6A|nr:high affinity copper uptake protein 1 isoform X2 [Sabethes cyaneus]